MLERQRETLSRSVDIRPFIEIGAASWVAGSAGKTMEFTIRNHAPRAIVALQVVATPSAQGDLELGKISVDLRPGQTRLGRMHVAGPEAKQLTLRVRKAQWSKGMAG